MDTSINKAHQELENLRDVLLSGTTAIQASLKKIEQRIAYMSSALALCHEMMEGCDITNKKRDQK